MKYNTVCLFMCSFLPLFVAMGGDATGRWYIFHVSSGIAGVPASSRMRAKQIALEFPYSPSSRIYLPVSWRWKMSAAATFEVFIPRAALIPHSYDEKWRVYVWIAAARFFYSSNKSLAAQILCLLTFRLQCCSFHSIQLYLYVCYSRKQS